MISPSFFLLQHRSLRQWLLLSLMLGTIAAAISYTLLHEYELAKATANDRIHNQLSVVYTNLEGQIGAANHAISGVIRDMPAWRKEKAQTGMLRRLNALSETLPGVLTLGILDAEGTVIESNQAELLGKNFAYREYFQAAQKGADPSVLYVSRPFMSSLGNYVITLARVITGKSGEFNGIVIASLDPKYFSTLLTSVLYAEDMRSAIVHSDGTLFLTMPTQNTSVGQSLATPNSLFSRHRNGGREESIFNGEIEGDQATRLIGMRTFQPPSLKMNTPLVLMISRAQQAIYANWNKNALALGGIYSLICLLLGGGLYFYQRRQRFYEQQAAEVDHALEQSNERLRLATSAAAQGVWEYDLATHALTCDDGMLRIYGIARENFGNSYNDWAAAVVSEDLPAVEAAWQVAVETATTFNTRFRVHRTDGQVRTIRTIANTFYAADGTPLKMIGINEDITAQEDAKRALHDAEMRFRTAFDNAAIGETLVSFDGRFMECNRALCNILGYSEEELKALTFQEITHPDDLNADLALLKELITHQRTSYRMEKRYIRKNGETVWALLSVSCVRNQAGEAQYFISQIQDITAHRLANEEIRRERDLFANGPVMVFVWNGDKLWSIEYMSPNVESILGYSEAMLTAPDFDFSSLIHPEDAPRIRVALNTFAHSRDNHIELTYRLKIRDGKYRWIFDFNVAERDASGKLLRMRGYAIDQTSSKKTEEALQNTTNLLGNVLDSAIETSIIVTDAAGLITIFNQGAERMLGYSAKEMVGKQTPTVVHLDEEIAARIETLTLELGKPVNSFDVFVAKAKVQGSDNHDWTYVRKDGTRLTVSLTVTSVFSSGGELQGYLGIARDVTAARAFQASLLEAKHQAEQANEAKTRFLANMSHEIRTPMNAILGMTQLLQHTELTPRQGDYIGKTQSAAQSLLAILNDILDFSKVEAGKMVLEQQPFEVDKLLRDLAVTLPSGGENKDVEIIFIVDPALPKVLVGDALRLQQVLLNLAGNAVKFTARGEVSVSLQVLSMNAQQVDVRFAVRDTGIGIDSSHLRQIFEGFTQAEASTTRRYGGTGLGLAISRRLVDLMEGELTVDSKPGVGSTFSFNLRLSRVSADTLPPIPATPHHRVLIVDDNETARLTLVGMAQSLGWQATSVSSGDAALKLLGTESGANQSTFDTIFIDWQMPDLDGWETSRQIRALQAGQANPASIIMVTAHGHALLTQRSAEEQALFDSFLIKPVTTSMLNSAAHEAASKVSGDLANRTIHATRKTKLRLQGLRLLVVEDNPINQRVAQELLMSEGASVILANNGKDGVAQAIHTQSALDAVLMDIQMPGMDGYTATRQIRSHASTQTLPIIAITANVLPTDREACIQAGMNDHIGKPIDLDTLVNALLKHCRPNAITLTPAPTSAPPPAPSPAPIPAPTPTLETNAFINASPHAAAIVDIEAALARIGGNKELFARMAQAFIADATALADQIHQSWRKTPKATPEELEHLLHTLKGIAGVIGADKLAQHATKTENLLLATPASAALSPLLSELDNLVHESCSILAASSLHNAAITAAMGAEPGTEGFDETALQILQDTLTSQLENRSMRSAKTLETLQQQFGFVFGNQLDPLAVAINQLDFALALRLCLNLKPLQSP